MTPKFNYKIFNKKTGKYFTGNKKSVWVQKYAVIDFITKQCKQPKNLGYMAYQPNTNIEDIEIHIFPIESATVVSAADFLEENKEALQTKETAKLKREADHNKRMAEWRVEDLKKRLKETEAELRKLTK